jgi:Spy/CpxP family protein refolding chaperone
MRLATPALALAAALLIAGPAPAQPPAAGGFNMFRPTLADSISRTKALQDELKMDAAQVEKLKAALDEAREDTRELGPQLLNRDATPSERDKVFKQMQEIHEKALTRALKPEQVKRLKQLDNQMAGLGMFAKPEVIAALKLTEDQRREMAKFTDDVYKATRDLTGRRPRGAGGAAAPPDPEAAQKVEAVQKEALANAVKVLTDEQRATFKDLTGEPFNMPGALGRLGFGAFAGLGTGAPAGPATASPGTVLTTNVQDQLKLTEDQKKELEAIQKDVDAKLEKMLTDEQRSRLKQMRDRQPGGAGAPKKN